MFYELDHSIKYPHTSDIYVLDEQNITNTKHWPETGSRLRLRGQTPEWKQLKNKTVENNVQ